MDHSNATIFAITLNCNNLEQSKEFYRQVFNKPVVNEDSVSALFSFNGVYLNLLHISAAAELFDPLVPSTAGGSPTTLFTVPVDSADDEALRLNELGVKILSGPIDRPWGIRTVNFADPDGNVWEFSQQLAAQQ